MQLRGCPETATKHYTPKMKTPMDPLPLYGRLVCFADTWEKCRASLHSLFAQDADLPTSAVHRIGIVALLCLQRAHDWPDTRTAAFAEQHPEIWEAIGMPYIGASLIQAWRERLEADSLDAQIVNLVQTEVWARAKAEMQAGAAENESACVTERPEAGPDRDDFPTLDTHAPLPEQEQICPDDVPAQEASPVPTDDTLSDALEELIYEPETEDASLRPGTVHIIGDMHYVVEQGLPRGYYRGRAENGDTGKPVLFHPRPDLHHALWLELDADLTHPRLPTILYRGHDGLVLEVLEGDPIWPGLSLPLPEAISHLHGVVQLMRFLATKHAVVTDIDLAGLRVTDGTGMRLQFLPVIAPMGTPAQVCFGDGVTPLQGSETACATEATSVFLWGAMLYTLVTGNSLSADGLHALALGQLREPGLPQLLSVSMLQPDPCSDLRTLMEHYRPLRVTPVPRYRIGAASTVGLNPTRLCNEDSYGFVHRHWEYHEEQMQVLRACVADGMGGEEAGEVASRAAVHAFCHHPPPPRLDQPDMQAQWTRDLGWAANEAVMDALANVGGGCTLTGIVVVGNRVTLAHVGDSRAYLYAQHELQRLSRDHSQVQAMVDSGHMTEDEAAASPDTNQIIRALGTAQRTRLHPEYVDSLASQMGADGVPLRDEWLDLHVGDLILLMSDGIWGTWEYRESVIAAELTDAIVQADFEPQAVADALIACALASGADDNATIVVVKRVQ